MSTAIPYIESPSIWNPHSSYSISSILKEIISERLYSITLGIPSEINKELKEVYSECSEHDWDNYGANPITETAYLEAERFINSLPILDFPSPEIVPEPSGEIGFEWNRGKNQIFVASVNGNNEIIYAGIFGPNKVHGTEYFGDSLPSIIITNLKRLYP